MPASQKINVQNQNGPSAARGPLLQQQPTLWQPEIGASCATKNARLPEYSMVYFAQKSRSLSRSWSTPRKNAQNSNGCLSEGALRSRQQISINAASYVGKRLRSSGWVNQWVCRSLHVMGREWVKVSISGYVFRSAHALGQEWVKGSIKQFLGKV